MDKVLVAVFDTETAAYEGLNALRECIGMGTSRSMARRSLRGIPPGPSA